MREEDDKSRRTLTLCHGGQSGLGAGGGGGGGTNPGEHWKWCAQGNGEATLLEEAGKTLSAIVRD